MQRVALDQELRFVSLEGIHPAADLLLLWCRMSPFSEKLGMALVELDPARTKFTPCGETTEAASFLTVDEGITGAYWGELAGQPLPEDMAALRAYADRLEEKYDVDIRLSDQCAGPCAASWEDITTTDQAGLEDEVAAIYPALEALDRTLALYPDGFFTQFRNARGEGGVQFLPVSEFHMSFEVIGMSFENGDWHCIAYQVSNERLEPLLCHEIWHAMEDKLISENWNAIDSWAWSACNPRGFDYYYDYDNAMNETDGSCSISARRRMCISWTPIPP